MILVHNKLIGIEKCSKNVFLWNYEKMNVVQTIKDGILLFHVVFKKSGVFLGQ